MKQTRFLLLAALLCLSASLPAQTTTQKAADVSKADPSMGAGKDAAAGVEWHDVTTWGAEGR